MDRVAEIRRCLEQALAPRLVEIEDQSHAHVGHPGAAAGGGHFAVTVVADAFEGLSLIERHRTVYRAVDALMVTEIHALSIRALTPDEHQSKHND